MDAYISISQATDWFWVGLNGVPHRVAVWAAGSNGETVGLLPVENKGGALAPPPPSLTGIYKHLSELSARERKTLDDYQNKWDAV